MRKVKQGNQSSIISILILSLLVLGFLGLFQTNQESFKPAWEEENDLQVVEEETSDYYINEGYTTFLPDPTPFTQTQPDGTEFTATRVGERVGGHIETIEGYSIEKDGEGWWTYAQKDDKGILIPTKHRVGKVAPETIGGLQKYLFNAPPKIIKEDENELPRQTRAPPLINTTWKAVALLLEFQDETFDAIHNQTYFSNMLNGTTGATMRNYYREVSYGQFDIEVDVFGPFQSSKVMAYYGDNAAGGRDNANVSASEMAREAVILANPTVDFSQYDLDGDFNIDALFIIHASSGEEQSGYEFDIWSHKSTIMPGESVDGVFARSYSTEPEDGRIGVFSHEFGHVLGLPDLYDSNYAVDGESDGIGKWGVMASGSWNGGGDSPAHFCAWSKIALGWVEPQIVTSDLSLFQLEIPPVWNNTVIYKIWAHDPSQDTTEYFLVENRQKSGFDSFLPGDGILIWHINETAPGNRNKTRLMVDLEEADGNEELITYGGPKGQAGDPWKNTVMGFRNTTTPNSSSYNGSDTHVWVWNISGIAGDGNMSVGFNEIYSGPVGIFISDPVSNSTIKAVYDFVINDTGFPDEDVGSDSVGNNGSYVLEFRETNTSDPFVSVSPQTNISWVGGVNGVINCSITEGFWDFRVKILDEEGHLLYTPIVYNIAVPTDIPPVADAGPDNSSDVNVYVVLDGSGSTDNSGYIAWFNWTFGDGTYYNGTESIVTHNYTEPGFYVVILNVSDSFGNWDTDIVNITVSDIGPPKTTFFIGAPNYRENVQDMYNVTANTSITPFDLSAVDNYEGVNFTWYTIDGMYFEGTTFNLVGYPEGEHNITWGSEDNVGNNETGNYMIVWLDNTPPTTDVDIDVPKYRANINDDWNVTVETLFTFLPVDDHAGVDHVWYVLNGTFYPSGTSFNLSGYNEGPIHIIYAGVDRVENAKIRNMWVYLDKSTPVTNISFGSPTFRVQGTDNWNITTTTLLTMVDNGDGNGCGINFTWYTIDGVYYEYSAPFTLTAGVHTLTWGGEDNLGLNETGNSQSINVDDNPPTTILGIDVPKYRQGGGDDYNVTDSTQFSLDASDLYAGVNHSWYLINGEYFTGSEFNLSGNLDGLYTIEWGSIDNLGLNESISTIQVYLDNTPPTTAINPGEPKYRAFGGNPWNITSGTQFSLSPFESSTGLNVTWYYIDGDYFEGTSFDLGSYGQGMHTIAWGSNDNIGNNETGNIMEVWVDEMPPETNLTIATPVYPSSPYNGCNVTSVSVFTLSGIDKPDNHNSSINDTWYTIDGIYFTGTSFDLSSYSEGPHAIRWGSIDRMGNNESGNLIVVWIDESPPETDLAIGNPKYPATPNDGLNVTSSTPFSFSGVDKPDAHNAGISYAWFIIDGDYYEGTSVNMSAYGDGQHNISWGGVDYLGNNETGKSISVWVDNSPPETDLSIGSPRYPQTPFDGTNITSATQLTLSGADKPDTHNSSLSLTWYIIDGDYYVGTSFDLSAYGEGSHIVNWGSIDNVDNNETGNSITVWVDDSAPVTQLAIGTPRYPITFDDGCNVTYATIFTLSGVEKPDAHNSGISITWHTIDGDYSEGTSFDLSAYGEGIHTITWGSLDNLNHNENGNSLTVWVDDSAPVTDLNIGMPRYPLSPFDGSNVTSTTVITLSGTDKPDLHNSGISATWYTIDGEYFTGTSFDLSGYMEGSHVITWGSEDNLQNNETGNSIIVWVDDSAPQTGITIGSPRYPLSPYDGSNVTSTTQIIFAESDRPVTHNAGVSFTWYMIDGDYYVGNSFDLSAYGEGSHIINWGSEDRLGNNETGNPITIWIDDSTPQTDLSVGAPRYPDSPFNGCNVTSATMISLSTSDKPDSHNAGIRKTWYSIDGDYYEGTSFDLSAYAEGPHTIIWGGLDNLDQNETGNVITLILDDSPPSSNLIIGEPKYRLDIDDLWNVTVLTDITISPVDPYSQVNFTWYTIDDVYFEGLIFNLSGYTEGLHTITWGSVDNLGWNETNSPLTVNLNFTSLVTVLTIDQPKYKYYSNDNWNVTSSSSFTLNVVVISNDPEFTWYTIDDEYFEYQGAPFDLSGYNEGLHTITWGSQDTLGFNESYNFMTVNVDDSGPLTSINPGSPKHPNTPIHNVTGTTPLNLSSTDFSGSQVASIYYLIQNDSGLVQDWTEYTKGTLFITLSGYGDGAYNIIFNATDNLGNAEVQNSYALYLDNTPPVTDISIGEPKYRASNSDYWNVTINTEFTLTPIDSASGVDITWYLIDGDYFESQTFDLTGYGDGMHIITWGAIDNLGNNETGSTLALVVDTTPPQTDRAVGTPKFRDLATENWNITDDTLFTLTSWDQNSGVSDTWYTIDDLYFEGISFTLSEFIDGTYIITYGSMDNLGNNETGNSLIVNLDTSSPVTTYGIGNPNHQDESGNWFITKVTSFTLSPWDEFSGVSFTWYTIDGVLFSGTAFNLNGYPDGLHTITWGSIDNLENNETGNSLSVYVDNTPPIILIEIGQPNGTVNNETHISVSTPITLVSLDSGVGVTEIYVSVDGGYTFKEYFSPFTVPSTTTSIVFRGEDVLGNMANESTFYVITDIIDTDLDGVEDIRDTDDDNDGILDVDEDLNRNGIVDEGETDPKNPDTDGDGYDDLKDKYPLDSDRHREPTAWEKVPIIGGYEQSFCLTVLILLIIIILILVVVIKKYRTYKAGVSWEKPPDDNSGSK